MNSPLLGFSLMALALPAFGCLVVGVPVSVGATRLPRDSSPSNAGRHDLSSIGCCVASKISPRTALSQTDITALLGITTVSNSAGDAVAPTPAEFSLRALPAATP